MVKSVLRINIHARTHSRTHAHKHTHTDTLTHSANAIVASLRYDIWLHLTLYVCFTSFHSSEKGNWKGNRNVNHIPQEAAEGRTAHINGWNGLNGMASNTWKYVFDVFDTIPPIPLLSLIRACSPQLRCHQLPVPHTVYWMCYGGIYFYAPYTGSFPVSSVLPDWDAGNILVRMIDCLWHILITAKWNGLAGGL